MWRPVVGFVLKRGRGTRELSQWSARLASVASVLNLVLLVGFPLAFLGRIEGGVPAFVYGVPAVASALLLIPPVTTVLTVGALISLGNMWRDRWLSIHTRMAFSCVVTALLAFAALAWYWRLLVGGT